MKNRYWGFALFFVLLMCTACGKSAEEQVAEQLELGNRYLEEMDYEQAIVAFNKAIEIDAKQVQAYIGGAEAYRAVASFDDALDLLDTGIENTQDKEIQEKIGEICYEAAQIYIAENDYEKAEEYVQRGSSVDSYADLANTEKEIQIRKNLLTVEDLLAEDNTDGVFELLQSDSWSSIQQWMEEMSEPIKLISGEKGIGIYPVISQFYGNYMIYYGEYQDGLRNGSGVWTGCQGENTYQAIGDWSGDKPNGEYEIKEHYSSLDDNGFVIRRIRGTVVNGLWNGDVDWAFEKTDGSLDDYAVSFSNGRWNILEGIEEEVGAVKTGAVRYIVSEDGYLSAADPNELAGIEGFVETVQKEETNSVATESAEQIVGFEPYSSDELVRMAFDYRARHGFYECQYISVDSEDENTVVLHCFDIIIDDPETGEGHTATYDWYTVDRSGKGFDLLGEEIDLNN